VITNSRVSHAWHECVQKEGLQFFTTLLPFSSSSSIPERRLRASTSLIHGAYHAQTPPFEAGKPLSRRMISGYLTMTGTAAKSFMFIDCNGDQTHKHTQQSLKRSHVVRESHRQSRAKRLAALKADNESIVLHKISSSEIGDQSIAAQPVTKEYPLESASQAGEHVDSDQDCSSILLHASKLLGPLGVCELDPLQVYPLSSNLQLYVDKIIDHGALIFQYFVKHGPRD
jgi:hypothetical protein